LISVVSKPVRWAQTIPTIGTGSGEHQFALASVQVRKRVLNEHAFVSVRRQIVLVQKNGDPLLADVTLDRDWLLIGPVH
jgi:hypothetical protein